MAGLRAQVCPAARRRRRLDDMIVDAIDLLNEHEIVHPSRVASASVQLGEFQLVIRGCPWWHVKAGDAEGQISFRFSRVSDGQMDLPALLGCEADEALEDFAIRLTSSLDWVSTELFQIYCSAPLSDPLKVYAIVQNYLLAQRASWTPAHYLNGARCLDQFLEVTASAGYLLATVPQSLRELVVSELQAQGVRHNVMESKARADGRLFVRILGSAFFCETAVAEFE